MLHIFSCLLTICFSSLEKCQSRASTYFLTGLFVFLIMSCLFILEVNPLSVDSFAIIFFHSENYLFILFILSFALQKLLNLIRSHLFIFLFIPITIGGGWKRILLWIMSMSVLPMFSSNRFPFKIYITPECTFYNAWRLL